MVDDASISIAVDPGSTLLETCGICGTQSGRLIDLNGFEATNMMELRRVVESYRLAARYQTLRPIRPECSKSWVWALGAEAPWNLQLAIKGIAYAYYSRAVSGR